MVLEKSAGAIIFRKEGEKPLFLLLHYPNSPRNIKKEYWGFPKGHIEKKEKLEEAAEREVEEETGLKDIKFIDGFKEQEKYFFTKNRKKIFKIATYLLAETPHQNKFGAGQAKKVKISSEHLGFKWLPYEKALKQLTFKNAREILKKANDYLNQKEKLLYLKTKV